MSDGNDLYRPAKRSLKRGQNANHIAKQMFESKGGKIEPLTPYNRPPFKEPDIKPSEGYCTQCSEWKDGKGSEGCLTCDKYIKYKKKTTIRNTFAFKHMSQEFMEAYADSPKIQGLRDAISKLPLDKSVPLLMQYFLGCTLQEIADYHIITKQMVDKKNKLSLEIIKESLRSG